jgi:hypothetical protein
MSVLQVAVSLGSNSLLSVYILQESALHHQTTRLWCYFNTRSDFQLQYITWTKIMSDGQRQFVYEYDRCAVSDRAYGSLAGRARLTVVEPWLTPVSGPLVPADTGPLPADRTTVNVVPAASIVRLVSIFTAV